MKLNPDMKPDSYKSQELCCPNPLKTLIFWCLGLLLSINWFLLLFRNKIQDLTKHLWIHQSLNRIDRRLQSLIGLHWLKFLSNWLTDRLNSEFQWWILKMVAVDWMEVQNHYQRQRLKFRLAINLTTQLESYPSHNLQWIRFSKTRWMARNHKDKRLSDCPP